MSPIEYAAAAYKYIPGFDSVHILIILDTLSIPSRWLGNLPRALLVARVNSGGLIPVYLCAPPQQPFIPWP